jgi:protease PrsW
MALLGAVLVLGVWLVYLQQIDGFEPKRLRYNVTILAGGMIFSCFVPPLHDAFVSGFRPNGTYLNDLFYYVLAVGVIEEALKVIPVLLVMRLTPAIEKPVDYIIYGSMSALGFAFMENLLPGSEWKLRAISTRALGAVILHMAETSLVMYGLFYSTYRVKEGLLQYFLLAFAAACALHGVFDFSAAKGWGVVSFLIMIYCIRQYGIFINCTLNMSEHRNDQPKRLVDLTAYLSYSLAAIIMLQYVIIAVTYDSRSANWALLGTAFFSCFLLFVILVYLGSFEIQKGQWLSLLRRKAISYVSVPSE